MLYQERSKLDAALQAAQVHGEELVGRMLRSGLRIDAVLGHGAFGTVYRGRQLAIDRDVAIKVLHPWFDPETEPARLFRDEIRAVGRIDHRNVVRIFDADLTPDQRLYFVMELVDGPTCLQLTEHETLSPARAVPLMIQLLEGLAAVHAAGHIHADIKPSNILVTGAPEHPRVVLVDFGLSRLRELQGPTEAVGGTRAFMAPEQLHDWKVEPRSDVYAAALVLVRLLTGWQRPPHDGERAATPPAEPPLAAIGDLTLRAALHRALADAPSQRPSAADFIRALRGGSPDEPGPSSPPPFHQLASLTEADRGGLHGRDADLMRLVRTLDGERALVLTAPSGTGKTSLLRAGLMPYLDAAGLPARYLACRAIPLEHASVALAGAIAEGEASITAAIATWHRRGKGQLVVVIDQLELWLADAGSLRLILDELLELDRRPAGARLAVVLSVREDFVAQLLTTTAALSTGAPMVRLAPLDRDGAERALGVPLQRRGVKMSAELMQLVLDELVHAGQEHGSQSGWGHTSAVYPPHLQLVGAALFSALAPGETELTLAHYERLGRLEAVVGELLERILRELSAEDRRIARALFLAFVGSAQTRVARSEEELAHRFGMAMQDPALARVLGLLEAHRLLLRRLQADATVIWELMHDSLVPRIEAWLTVQDLDRRRAAELLRFHLRESTPQAPSLLSARQLALVAQFPGLVEELEQEWLRRPAADWTPQRLLARSRMTAQYRRALSATVAGTALVLAALLAWNLWTERARRAQEALLRDRDLGRFDLVLAPFDWRADPAGVQQLPVDSALLPALHWTLHDPDPGDPSLPGPAVSSDRLRHGQVLRVAGHRIEKGIEARGGDGFLMISGRGGVRERCPASVVPIRRLPGYATHGAPPRVLRVAVPTCQATRFDTIDIPAGPFVSGGAGEPPPSFQAHELPAENPAKWLATYAIDRTEITNAAYAAFASMASLTGTLVVEPPASLPQAADPTRPRTDLNAFDAAAFCRYLGKQLPDNDQWQKAMRGGLLLPDGTRNPQPRRNLPWGTASTGRFPAHLADTVPRRPGSHETAPGASDVEAYPGDRSPYGVIGLAGNVQEWTRTSMPRPAKNPGAPVLLPMRITRGGNWSTTSSSELVDYMVSENERSPRQLNYYLGARCVLDVNAGSAAALAPVPSPAPAGRPPHAGSRR